MVFIVKANTNKILMVVYSNIVKKSDIQESLVILNLDTISNNSKYIAKTFFCLHASWRNYFEKDETFSD